jgi:uncharacterized oxidoreductase
MRTNGNVVLITGGGTGIGLALAEAFMKAGNAVGICGRRADQLDEARRQLPAISTLPCDVADPAQRVRLVDWAGQALPGLNVLVNNAGVQLPVDFLGGAAVVETDEDEIDINLKAPIRLAALFIPHLARQGQAAIVNISSGLGFVPLASVPVYCATKAAMHSFSLSLRHQLRDTSIRVFEVIPPTVETGLDRGRRERAGFRDRGILPDEVAKGTLLALETDTFEAPIGGVDFLRLGARTNPEQVFQRINGG